MSTRKKLVLIDGHALAYRMFYALSTGLRTREGELTNAVYGFTRTLLELMLGEDRPDYLAVSFDVEPTFRNEMYAEYKGTREKMPEELGTQIGRIHEVLAAFNVPILIAENYEADDVLGTVARRATELGVDTLIITGDKDLLQLVDEHVHVQLPRFTQQGAHIFDIEKVKEEFGGLEPLQIIDYKGLVGDTSDNIPGVRGVGAKTATALLLEYGSLDGVYKNLDQVSGKKRRETLQESREIAFLSAKLARIVTDVPLDFNLEACVIQDFDANEAFQVFQKLEFHSFTSMLEQALAPPPEETSTQLSFLDDTAVTATVTAAPPTLSMEPKTKVYTIRTEGFLVDVIKKMESVERIAFDTETTSLDKMQAELVGISLSYEVDEAYYIPVGHQGDANQLPLEIVLAHLRPIMSNPEIAKIGHNIKYDAMVLAQHGLDVHPLSIDTMIAEWLLNPDSRIGLKEVAFARLGVKMTEITELIGKGRNQITFDQVRIDDAAPYAAADADLTLQLADLITPELSEQGLDPLFYDIEMPLVPVLVDMERAGVLVNVPFLEELSADLHHRLAEFEQGIYKIAGQEFNLNSTQQLSEVLFDTLGLPTEGLRKTKSGYYSTAASVLDSLQESDETGIIDAILRYRELEKLRSTYVDALPELVNPVTGRIHSSFNQTGAVTGRLSSSNPNLQNIPIRSEEGRRVRDAFIAAPGHVLIGADYSQVELRILAHVSSDDALIDAFRNDQDIHATTAAAVNHISLEEVTSTQRSFAKSVNFGLMYGMGAFRLARESGLTRDEAEAFIKAYFERFPKVRQYLDETKEKAKELGYVETLLGRRREFQAFQAESTGRQANLARQRAEREAINTPIQGTAADIIKIAMVKLHNALNEQKLAGKMILQVHDELLLEVPEEEADRTMQLVVEVMETAYPLDVPLKVDAHQGRHWGELK
ncbi:MAG: DNA polymerase I [Chloroflexi bacterium]|nr:DNA polymerase I [Chloroflexota bacterium]